MNRDFKKNDSSTEIKSEKIQNISSNITPDTTTDAPGEAEKKENEATIITKDSAYQITKNDCNNNCKNIEPVEKLTYCNQICGLTTLNKKSCDDLADLNKDYCLRDEAVAKKDLSKCSEIQDGGIEKQCLNRINEDFIDDIMK